MTPKAGLMMTYLRQPPLPPPNPYFSQKKHTVIHPKEGHQKTPLNQLQNQYKKNNPPEIRWKSPWITVNLPTQCPRSPEEIKLMSLNLLMGSRNKMNKEHTGYFKSVHSATTGNNKTKIQR